MLSAGIVGLPNVGKSTLFNAVTRTRKAQAANYPFCTIDPNVGVVTVPDPRLAALSKLSSSKKLVPAAIEFVDIAGLVKGASAGEGLGNQFLSHIREVHAIVQVVRCFEDDDIHHVSGTVDPVRDIEVINTELILADLAAVQKRADRQTKAARAGDKAGQGRSRARAKNSSRISTPASPRTTLELSDDEQKLVREFFLLCGKPTIFACNVAESRSRQRRRDRRSRARQRRRAADRERRTHRRRALRQGRAGLRARAFRHRGRRHQRADRERTRRPHRRGSRRISARTSASPSSGVGSLIRAVYHLLGLRTYLTTGEQETRAWTIRAGDKAPAAAGVIHSDFERGFIAAEIVHFDDLIRLGSNAKAREAGKLRIEGKEYVVKDGDVVEFRFNV